MRKMNFKKNVENFRKRNLKISQEGGKRKRDEKSKRRKPKFAVNVIESTNSTTKSNTINPPLNTKEAYKSSSKKNKLGLPSNLNSRKHRHSMFAPSTKLRTPSQINSKSRRVSMLKNNRIRKSISSSMRHSKSAGKKIKLKFSK
jgi:hypothetical protein